LNQPLVEEGLDLFGHLHARYEAIGFLDSSGLEDGGEKQGAYTHVNGGTGDVAPQSN
jgi:hypothetical protein